PAVRRGGHPDPAVVARSGALPGAPRRAGWGLPRVVPPGAILARSRTVERGSTVKGERHGAAVGVLLRAGRSRGGTGDEGPPRGEGGEPRGDDADRRPGAARVHHHHRGVPPLPEAPRAPRGAARGGGGGAAAHR